MSGNFNTPNVTYEALHGTDNELLKKYVFAEVNHLLKRKFWLIQSKSKVLQSGRKSTGFKWLFKKKKEPAGIIR